jgi:hypothetical protein
LDQIGLVLRIIDAVYATYVGRKGLTIYGEEHEGYRSYDFGIGESMAVFKEAHAQGQAITYTLVINGKGGRTKTVPDTKISSIFPKFKKKRSKK